MSNKNRYDRKTFSNKEIEILFIRYKSQHKFKSLFIDKIFDSYYKWRNDVIRHMDFGSCNKFFFRLEPEKKCTHCSNVLGIESYYYAMQRGKNKKGFRKYCPECLKFYVWQRGPIDKKSDKYKAIKEHNIRWSKTKEAQAQYKKQGIKNSEFMSKFSITEKGIQSRKEAAIKQSVTMKKLIAEGKFVPPITNAWTHWSAVVRVNGIDYKFRSSWEACFYVCNWYYVDYETLRILYVNERNENKIYIADFYDAKTHTIYEIKPKSMYLKQIHKMSKIIEHCIANNIKFVWVNESNILQFVDIKKFDKFNILQYNKMIKHILK